MSPPTPRTTSKRTLLGLGVAALVPLAALLVDHGMTDARERRVAEDATRKAREAAELARDTTALQTQAVSLMAENAAANPRFIAAVRGRVDRGTFADLLATESWWEPYRSFLTTLSYDGATLAFAQTEGPDGLAVGEIIRQVAAGGRAIASPLSGHRGAFLVAARPVAMGPGVSPAVLVLARRVDGPLLETIAGRSGRAVMLSDGRRPLARGGADGPQLESLVGRERSGDVGLVDPAVHAAAISIAPGLWLWAASRAGDSEVGALAADRVRRQVLWALAIPLALIIGIGSLRRRPPAIDAPPPAPRSPGGPNADLPGTPTRFGVSPSAPFDGATTLLAAVPPGPGRPLGRYLLVDQIGEGGMAEVFTAVSFGYGGFRRSFVVKRLRPELNGNATAVDLFIDEANLASTLVHPNVVPVFDFGEAAGSYYLAQEYVSGRDLGRFTRRLRERGEPLLSTSAIVYLAHEVLTGLEYAHGKRDDAGNPLGLVHRDITPENVIISERGEVKILDFGIVKAKQRVSQTEIGTVKGSVGFMSPEQARGRVVDQRSDLFSLGLVILYVATCEPTYEGETFYDLLTAAASGPTDAHRARIAALPAPLPAILGRALAIDPAQRFQSCAEFNAALAPFLASFLAGGGPAELSARLLALYGDELRAEQERLAGALPNAPRPEPLQGSGGR